MPSIKIEELNIEDTHNNQHIESDDEEPPVEETQIEEVPTSPSPKKQSKKQQESVTCPQCNKSTLLKTFTYYHSYKCRPEMPQQAIVKETIPEKIEVSFNADFNKKDQRNNTIKRLISRAF